MIKLNYIVPADKFGPAQELWKIDQDFDIDIVRYNNYAVVSVWSPSGDVTNQIYERIKFKDYFSDLKLGGISNYTIDVPLEKLEKFLEFIEKIDRTTLKEGKTY